MPVISALGSGVQGQPITWLVLGQPGLYDTPLKEKNKRKKSLC